MNQNGLIRLPTFQISRSQNTPTVLTEPPDRVHIKMTITWTNLSRNRETYDFGDPSGSHVQKYEQKDETNMKSLWTPFSAKATGTRDHIPKEMDTTPQWTLISIPVQGQSLSRDAQSSPWANDGSLSIFAHFYRYPSMLLHISWFLLICSIFSSVLGSPSRVRVCCAACGTSEPSEKTRPWNLGVCTLWVLLLFIDFCWF